MEKSIEMISDRKWFYDSTVDIIVSYFVKYKLNSACLAQSFFLYDILKKYNILSKIIKGFVVIPEKKIYYGHFWIETWDNIILDPGTKTFNKLFITTYKRKIVKKISKNIKRKYVNIDMQDFEKIRSESLNMALNGNFWNDVQDKRPENYVLLLLIYKNITDKIDDVISKLVTSSITNFITTCEGSQQIKYLNKISEHQIPNEQLNVLKKHLKGDEIHISYHVFAFENNPNIQIVIQHRIRL
ncbi:putative orfan [Tupanvirus soda lake]|uniref:Orfan n=2 Tax=Tupanvirus TaxID=2094720 RepID=A0AC62ACW5_9VIRU|nr:putative orfan [Tupanvirus soda lake]QKU35631.1 putative orfan [Tupanvirus soda lake]